MQNSEVRSRTDQVKAWFASHLESEAAQEMVTDDVAFTMPPSSLNLMTGNLPWNGRDSLKRLGVIDHALYKSYGQPSKMNLHFMIEEGDWVLMQFDSKFDTWEDEVYHNFYVIAIRFDGEKIAETIDLADTAYLEELIMGTPEKLAGFKQRIADLRAEMNAPSDVW
jgi:hypothetical protein